MCNAFSASDTIVPHFFENVEGRRVTGIRERYRTTIENCMWLQLEKMYLDVIWFQLDEVTRNITGEATV